MAGKRVLSTGRKRLSQEKRSAPGWMMPRINQRREAQARAEASGANFMVGGKKVYLPTFHIQMQRKTGLGPKEALFQVPLYFSKLDLKDLLWHAYGVETHAISSYVTATKPRQHDAGSIRDLPGKQTTYLPLPKKKMIVQLEKPFTWPAKPNFTQSAAEGKLDKDLAERENTHKDSFTSADKRRRSKQGKTSDIYDAMIDRANEQLRDGREFKAPPEKEDEGEKQKAKPTRDESKQQDAAAAEAPTEEPTVGSTESSKEPTERSQQPSESSVQPAPEPQARSEIPISAQDAPNSVRTQRLYEKSSQPTTKPSRKQAADKGPPPPLTEHEQRVRDRAALLFQHGLRAARIDQRARSGRKLQGIEL